MAYPASARTDATGRSLGAMGLDFYSMTVPKNWMGGGSDVVDNINWVYHDLTTLERLFADDKMSVLAINLSRMKAGMEQEVYIYKPKEGYKNSIKVTCGSNTLILHGGKIHNPKQR